MKYYSLCIVLFLILLLGFAYAQLDLLQTIRDISNTAQDASPEIRQKVIRPTNVNSRVKANAHVLESDAMETEEAQVLTEEEAASVLAEMRSYGPLATEEDEGNRDNALLYQ